MADDTGMRITASRISCRAFAEKCFPITGGLLCLAALCFPFSVAATNAALGASLVTGILSGDWLGGARQIWMQHRHLTTTILLYLGLILAGILWSNNRALGMHVLGHQWFWLLLPMVFSVLYHQIWRQRFLFFLSLGLALHLGLCVLQVFGLAEGTTAGGSSMDDPTGHIGRIGFGFVYGIWAAWLLHLGWLRAGWQRWCVWILATWAWLMIFLAQGRSGYLIAFVLLTFVVGRQLLGGHGWKRVTMAFGLILLMAVALAAGPGKQRLVETWNSIQSIQRGDVATAEGRWSLWLEAVDIWREHPFIGVGTGGYAAAAVQVFKEHPEYTIKADHPHNAYLLSMARWGTGGLVIVLLLLYTWIRTGWQVDWNQNVYAPLISLSGLAIAVHGLSASSLEEHFSAVLAVLLLGAGLSERVGAHPSP